MNDTGFAESILAKVQSARCLSQDELDWLAVVTREIDSRRQLDVMDAQWERDVRAYVARRPKGGGLYVVSKKESFVGIAIGLGMSLWGICMLWQCWLKGMRWPLDIAEVFFAAVALMGLGVVIMSAKVLRLAHDYEQKKKGYLEARAQITEKLPDAARLPVRFCPNCLSESWWAV